LIGPRSALVAAILVACSKSSSSGASGPDATPREDGKAATDAPAAAPEDPVLTDLWTRAASGDDDDLERLCRCEGTDRLVEMSVDPGRRPVALRALAFSEDFTPLPFLAEVASGTNEAEATVALASVAAIAAQPRRATDPEDVLELVLGDKRLLALSRDPGKPAARRLAAIRALRLLADRGGLDPREVPGGVDAH